MSQLQQNPDEPVQNAEHDYFLLDEPGHRLYLTAAEREVFLENIDRTLAKPMYRQQRTLCLILYWTGCRISEALELKPTSFDYANGGVVLRTLKRRSVKYRFVPLPPEFLRRIDDVHHVKDYDKSKPGNKTAPLLWDMNRSTAWRCVKKVMDAADITGPQATAKGLRHAFVIAHQALGTPEHMIQRWAGWSTNAMMAVYGAAVGQEETALVSKLWELR